MKTAQSKTTKIKPAATSEECGVWLDVAELRAKKPKKRLIRPISKLLNPLAQSGGYSMAVALSFTQTKLSMPATKQSTISSFFQPQRKNNKDTEDNPGTPCPSEMSFTPLPETHTGTKRKRGMPFELTSEPSRDTSHTSQVHPEVPDAEFKKETDEFCKDGEKEKHFFHLIWGCRSEDHEPAEKRRRPEDTTFKNIPDTQKGGNGAIFDKTTNAEEIGDIPQTLPHRDQAQQDSFVYSNRICRNVFIANEDGSSSYNSVKVFQSQEALCPSVQKGVFTTRTAIENQNTLKHPSNAYKGLKPCEQNLHHIPWSPVKTKDKENGRPTSSSHFSPLKQQLSPSPVKLFTDFKMKYCPSPKKSLGDEDDSLAKLFTQDSEGFRVIANRKLVRYPLKDSTNSAEGIEPSNVPKPVEPEEDTNLEAEMLFTQDSQGNMVIKH